MDVSILFDIVVVLGVCAVVTSAQEPSKGRYAPVNGLRMYYEIQGKGEPLVLIHGGGSTIATSFGRIMPILARDFQVIAVELQAHGHTSDRDAPESFAQDADDVAALLHHLRIAEASFLGFSNGGNTAMQFAMRHPGIVNRLILASAFYKREGLVDGLLAGLKHATLQDMPKALRDAFLQATPDSNKLLTMFTKDRERMIQFADWNDEMLLSIKAPTLIINGDRDVVRVDHAAAMAELIANCRLLIVPGTHGEYLGVAEIPDPDLATIEFTAGVVKKFLRKQ